MLFFQVELPNLDLVIQRSLRLRSGPGQRCWILLSIQIERMTIVLLYRKLDKLFTRSPKAALQI